MDFFAGAAASPALYTVAAASGIAARPSGYTCWLEINHGGGWTTSYYHLQNTYVGGTIEQNGSVGIIAREICAGGFATGPHVHFSLKFNGAYTSLEGVKLSGWTIHVGLSPYTSGTIERDGVHLTPGAQVLNDYHLRFPREDTSLRFFGNGQAGVDRVTIQLDAPSRPADVGSDFTLEWWMKALPGDNNQSSSCTTGAGSWRAGNIVFDRDILADGEGGEFGISLTEGRIAFGLNDAAAGITLCGARQVDDRAWHHISVTRSVDGAMRIFVDGKLDAEGVGPSGDISYPDGRETEDANDPFLVIGAEKHNLGAPLLGFQGWIDEVRISDMILYTGDFTPPSSPLTAQASTLALYSFNEGAGDMIWDVSGYPGGPSNGSRLYGGSPAGPEWSAVAPFGNTFTDVFGSHWAYDYIEALADAGLAAGYPDGSYRPSDEVTRGEVAVFLLKGMHGASYSPDAPDASHPFDDITGHWAEAWIETLYDEGLTSGYPDGSFRPDGLVERGELAVFLLRATHGQDYAPPPADGNPPFSDIHGHWAEAWIQQLWREGLTAGYPDNTYRPDAAVSRAEIAIFLVQAFELPLP